MQFTQLAAFVAAALAASAMAAPSGGVSQCNGSTLKCCNSVQENKPTNKGLTSIIGLLGLDASQLAAQVGITCTAVNVLAVGGNKCAGQTACCSGNNFNGLVNAACVPVNVQV
ncbi:fruiting body protein SC1 [Coprinopsis sp. MPI-PUGE-AT-0042]|nr:fruiting body protein SC1 [Coprinopsis sp. MPI-PUGE-AT-0042]